MAVSWKDLYGANWSKHFGGGGGTYNSSVLRKKYEDVYADTMEDMDAGSGSSGGGSAPVSKVQTWNPPPVMPTYAGGMSWSKGGGRFGIGPGAGIEIPVYDTQRVEALAQRAAAPGIRNLRNAMQQTQQGYYENPNVKRMTLRDVLAGYGQGLENVMGGALQQGKAMYNQEYQPQVQKAFSEFEARENRALQSERLAAEDRRNRYNRAWENYQRRLG
ncbi:MAG: hypothetical protein AB1585_19180 [Thermodesulfobacteriota bacterium]